MVMEAVEPHNLSVSRRTGKAGGVTQLKSEGLGTRGQWCGSWVDLKDPEAGVLMSENRRRWTSPQAESKWALSLPFCSIQAPKHWVMPNSCIGDSNLILFIYKCKS